MKLYRIKEEYYDLLHNYDNRVLYNKGEKRPYVGVVLKINNFNYYIPLSSPKPKHLTMKNNKDFIKLDGGNLGALNINCMLPVDAKNLIKFDINQESPKYRDLLRNQLVELKSSKETILKNAEYIYSLHNIASEDLTPFQSKLLNRCCNFKQLERVCYNQSYESLISKDLIKNQFSPNKNLISNITKLSCTFNSFQSLSEIKNKYKAIDTYSDESKNLIKDIVTDLRTQEQKREVAITAER